MPVENKHPCFILVNPQMGENIGASARGMWNFGIDRMRIVSPRDGWPNQKAVVMASGAGRLLDEALIFQNFTDAIADQHFIFGTTARPRDLIKPIYSPEEAVELAYDKISKGQNVGFAFGPERSGLENSDIIKANAIGNNCVIPKKFKNKEKIVELEVGDILLFHGHLIHHAYKNMSESEKAIL